MPIVSSIVFSLLQYFQYFLDIGIFTLKLFGLDTKRKLNGNRMYMLLHPIPYSKINGL